VDHSGYDEYQGNPVKQMAFHGGFSNFLPKKKKKFKNQLSAHRSNK
jgi:hypothetical protein